MEQVEQFRGFHDPVLFLNAYERTEAALVAGSISYGEVIIFFKNCFLA